MLDDEFLLTVAGELKPREIKPGQELDG